MQLAHQVTQDLYMPEEIRPELLRAMIDQLQLDLKRQELVHKTDTHEMDTLVREKHLNTGIALNELRVRLGRLETQLAIIYGDPERKEDKGRLGSHDRQLEKLWAAREIAKDERWKLRLAVISISLGGGSAAAIALKILGIG